MHQHDGLIVRLKERVRVRPYSAGYEVDACRGSARPPLSRDQLVEAERLLGFRLPMLVRRLYLEVADGFWGPGYGLSPLLTGSPDVGISSVVESMRGHPEIGWPNNLFPFCSWGCGFDSYIDYTDQNLPIIYEDIDYSGNEDINYSGDGYLRWPSGYSLDEFLLDWLEGR